MKIIFLSVFLCITPCFANEPNEPYEPNDQSNDYYDPVEVRLILIEERIEQLEWRIVQLEASSEDSEANDMSMTRNDPLDPNKNALRLERAQKKIQEAKNAIILAETKIKSLPRPPSGDRFLEEKLNILNEKWKILTQIEANYKIIIRFAKKNPELSIDILSIQKSNIECQNRKKQVEIDKQRIIDILQKKANANRGLNKIAPSRVRYREIRTIRNP
jgi:hypothetical protein